MKLEDLMERAAQYDENLARDIKDYVHGRNYGLVYEASKPEFVRMWKKPVVRGDIVNVLPPRGVMEDTKNEDDPSEIVYKVISISDGVATLRNENSDEAVTASVDDIVALARFDKPIYAGLKEIGRVERGGDKPYHVVINGENYHALQTLVYAYQGQVDCIYIDPPYNTGATDWKYNNNYVGKDDKYRHSKWLTFMEDRLRLAKKLLNPKNSALIVTIDEKEYLRLGLLLEQLFPEAKIQMVSSVINPKGQSRNGLFGRTDEYLYFVMFGSAVIQSLPLERVWRSGKSTTTDKIRWQYLRRPGKTGNVLRQHSPGCFYPIFVTQNLELHSIGAPLPINESKESVVAPEGTVAIWPMCADGREGCYQVSPDNLKKLHEEGFLHITEASTSGIHYLKAGERNKVETGVYKVIGYRENDHSVIVEESDDAVFIPGTQWNIPTHNAGDYGKKIINEILNDARFTYPKSLYATHDAIQFVVANNPNALIIDFFGGSGTTLHAVNLINAEDGGQRKCILVTNNEVSEDEEKSMTSKGLRPTDEEWQSLGIARYVAWPRTVCSIEGHDISGAPLKGNYIDSELPMSDGFEENAIFFDLEYLEPSVVSADLAFDRIAPILWLAGGCEGEILQRQKGYVIGETYAVLFDPRYKTRFVDAVSENKEIKTAFIVTDAAERYRSLCADLPGCRVMQLYESYLRSFEINAIG